jgi:hypothetical protein
MYATIYDQVCDGARCAALGCLRIGAKAGSHNGVLWKAAW